MTSDTELQNWKEEWRERTGPLPQWKARIRRQNLWMAGSAALLGVALALSTGWALRAGGSFAAGLASGMWLATVALGGYGWWVRRGAWKPGAQTTLAYMELAHRRAVAKARQLRFSSLLLLAVMVPIAIFLAWSRGGLGMRELALLAACGIELIFFHRYRRRKEREAERTRQLIAELKE